MKIREIIQDASMVIAKIINTKQGQKIIIYICISGKSDDHAKVPESVFQFDCVTHQSPMVH